MYTLTSSTVRIPAGIYIRQYRDTEKFIAFCKQCGQYGNCWACPPYDFDTDAYLSDYQTAWLIGTKITPADSIREQSIGEEQALQTGKTMLTQVREELDARLLALEKQHPGSRAFFAGTCHACPQDACTRKEGLPCSNPDRMRPSLEALGFDLGRTSAELLGIEMQWSRKGELPEYFTLVSGFFTRTNETVIW